MITVWCARWRHAIKRSPLNHKTVKIHHKVSDAPRNNNKKDSLSLSHLPLEAIITRSTWYRLNIALNEYVLEDRKTTLILKSLGSAVVPRTVMINYFASDWCFLEVSSPHTGTHNEAHTHYSKPPKRIHWFNPRLSNCSSSLSVH